MATQIEIETYNYAQFVSGSDFFGFRSVLQVGSAAPDFTATLLDTGQPVKLSDYWSRSDVLIEFGSLT